MVRKIIWAVDLAAEDEKLQLKMAGAIKAFSHGMDCSVEPVHVLSSAESYPQEPGAVKWSEMTGLPGGLPLRTLSCWGTSIKTHVEVLLEYAYENKCDLIAASTHARRGVRRATLGSFVETLLSLSRLPILSVNPVAKVPLSFQKVLFPSDFVPESRQLFERAIDVASRWDAKVLLLHKMKVANAPPWAFSPAGVPTLGSLRELTWERMKREWAETVALEKDWEGLANRQFVATESIMDETPEQLDKTILHYAKGLNDGIVVMPSHVGTLGALFLGSTTKRIIRAAPCPVMAMHVVARERLTGEHAA